MNTRAWRHLEVASFGAAAAVAAVACAIGLVGPSLGGSDPGLAGVVGWGAETILAGWLPGGVLAGAIGSAAVLRRRWAASATLLLVASITCGPHSLASLRPRARPLDRAALRVASVNLGEQNLEDPAMEGALRLLDADVLVLPEFTHLWEERLAAWFVDDYPTRHVAEPEERFGHSFGGLRIAVWSRLPAVGEFEVRRLAGAFPQAHVRLAWGDREFSLLALHLRKPYPLALYSGAFRDRCALLDWLEEVDGPTLIAGDFNASARSALLARLAERGFASAAQTALGRSPTTWPTRGRRPGVLGVAIDHVLYTDAFEPFDYRAGPATGSDHLPVLALFGWRDGRRGSIAAPR